MAGDPLRRINAPNRQDAEQQAFERMEHFSGLRVARVAAYVGRERRTDPFEVVPWRIEFDNGEALEFSAGWLNTSDAELLVEWRGD